MFLRWFYRLSAGLSAARAEAAGRGKLPAAVGAEGSGRRGARLGHARCGRLFRNHGALEAGAGSLALAADGRRRRDAAAREPRVDDLEVLAGARELQRRLRAVRQRGLELVEARFPFGAGSSGPLKIGVSRVF